MTASKISETLFQEEIERLLASFRTIDNHIGRSKTRRVTYEQELAHSISSLPDKKGLTRVLDAFAQCC